MRVRGNEIKRKKRVREIERVCVSSSREKCVCGCAREGGRMRLKG